MAKFLLQTSTNAGTYRNPFKSGGYGIRYSPWKTEQKLDTMEQAKDAFRNFNQSGLKRRRIVQDGRVMINAEGRVFEIDEYWADSACTHKMKGLRYVETI